MRLEMTVLAGGHVIVALSGEFDIAAASAMREALAEAADRAVRGVIVDMGQVTFVDAAVLGVLAGASRRTRHLPDGLRLAAVPARVARLLRLAKLDGQLAVFPVPPASPLREHAIPLALVTGWPAGEELGAHEGEPVPG